MYRKIVDELVAWKEDMERQVLVVKGAKGVGKTWCVIDFASAFFDHRIHIDFSKDAVLKELFMTPHDPQFIDDQLMLLSELDLTGDHREDTVLIFDEVQIEEDLFVGVMQYARARRNLSIIIIASWMGMLAAENLLAEEIRILYMYPMTFEEYMTANKAQELCRMIEDEKLNGMTADILPIVVEYLHQFYITGGMPEVVSHFIKNHDYEEVEMIQKRILQEMRNELLKYSPKFFTSKILQVWDSVPEQLIKDNRKFMYGYIDPKARAREYVGAVNWLVNAGFVRKIHKVKAGTTPLSEQMDRRSFELYYLDHGLLRSSLLVPAVEADQSEYVFALFDGLLSEQYVYSELTLNPNIDRLYFWTSGATARIGFVFEDDGEVVPVDVQPTIRKKAQNMKVFRHKYGNHIAIRISMEPLTFHKGLLNVPLYGLWNF